MTDTTQVLEILPEHLYQLSELVKQRELSDAAFRTLLCIYSLAWSNGGGATAPMLIDDLVKYRRITTERFGQHLNELADLRLIEIIPVKNYDEADPAGKIDISFPHGLIGDYEWPIKRDQYIRVEVSPAGIVNAQAKDFTIFRGSVKDAIDFLQSPDLDDLP